MPLLGKKPFERIKPPKDLRPNEELFYCKITHEVFRQYEHFFDRVILCNSLVWTCSLTGRPGLTYQEALESEKNARLSLKKFPEPLKRPLLFLCTLTSRTRINDMCDDVYAYVKDRYFVGEQVEVSLNGIKKQCEITKVISPDKEQKSPNSKHEGKPKKVKNVSSDKLKYEVKGKENGKIVVVKSQCISRPKGEYTKVNNKLFIKHHATPEDGTWRVKDEAVDKYELDNFKFKDVFCGTLPKYAVSPTKKKVPDKTEKPVKEKKKSSDEKKSLEGSGKKTVQGKLNFKNQNEEEKLKLMEKEQEEFEKSRMVLEEERQKKKEELKKRVEEDREKRKEQLLKERERKKEEKKKMAEYLSSWKKPRDDLECDDLKDLPKPTPVDCSIPMDCFGDAVMILEFLNGFGDLIKLKDSFSQGFMFEHLEKALLETDIQGCLNDLVQLLLTSIFQYEDIEVEKTNGNKEPRDNGFKSDMTTGEAVAVANAAFSWPRYYHGTELQNVPLDSFSVTEVLRLHIMASGSDKNFSFAQGLNGVSEDPGLYFKMEETELLKKLGNTSIFQISCEERVKILSLLIHQLTSYETFRNAIEENILKVRPLKMELKHLRWAYSRRLKEDAVSKVKKKPDEKDIKTANTENKDTSSDNLPVKPAEDEEKENVEVLTPEQLQELEEKRKREEAKRKADFLRKEKELKAQIQLHQSSYQVNPVGRDRAFRRFWVFQSLPGIFIEDDDAYVGPCLLKETPQAPLNSSINRTTDTAVNNIKKYLHHLNDTKNGSSDKENDILQDLAIIQSDISAPLKDRRLSDLNTRVDSKKSIADNLLVQNCLQCKEKMSDIEGNGPRYCPHVKVNSVFGMCTAFIDTCPVHNLNAPRTRWSFLYKEEELDTLLNSLNPRGYRESALKDALNEEKDGLKEILSKCQYNLLNTSLPPPPPQPEVRKSQRHQNARKSDFADMKPEDALELTLRDMILELEQRIYAGALGCMKVLNRDSWREAIEQRAYDRQCEQGTWDSKFPTHVKKENMKEVDPVVRDLAFALFQVSSGIEAKFLHPPLGESDNFKQQKEKYQKNMTAWETKQKSKDTDKDEKEPSGSCPVMPKPPILRWQESLVQCSSLSQLFVHLGTLERSVAWSRSILKAHCRICRRRGDAENMLLCDGCNRGHHLYCLKPPLEEIPQGDWFCISCKPPEKIASPKKKRQMVEINSEEEEEESENDEDRGSVQSSSNSNSDEDEECEDDVDEENGEDESEYAIEVCETCGEPGTVICCDKCPKVYHPECVSLKRIPRGEWLCPKCTKREDAIQRSKRHGLSGSYSTRAHSLANSDSKAKSSKTRSLRPKIQIKPAKREKIQDESDSDFDPDSKPTRSSRTTKRQRNQQTEDSSDSDVQPSRKAKTAGKRQKRIEESSDSDAQNTKKARADSSSNMTRRRSKSAAGSGETLDYKTCVDILVELMRHPSGWPFLAPVSKKDAPGYHQIIKRPMDFGTIRSRLNNMNYKNNDDFVHDVYLVLQNCELYNPRDSVEYKAAKVLNKELKRLLAQYELSNAVSLSKQHHNR